MNLIRKKPQHQDISEISTLDPSHKKKRMQKTCINIRFDKQPKKHKAFIKYKKHIAFIKSQITNYRGNNFTSIYFEEQFNSWKSI